jgi:regulator of nucleoside diphosphate kinase
VGRLYPVGSFVPSAAGHTVADLCALCVFIWHGYCEVKLKNKAKNRNAMIITVNDYKRLTGFVEFASLRTKMPEIVLLLNDELRKAKILAREKISENVITMNSRVLLKNLATDSEAELTLTYPPDAEPGLRKVSVFSPIGVALLGKQVGDITSWKTPKGNGSFEILKVTYQPEAVGDYSL